MRIYGATTCYRMMYNLSKKDKNRTFVKSAGYKRRKKKEQQKTVAIVQLNTLKHILVYSRL